MKTRFVVLTAALLVACEYDVREEEAPRRHDPSPYGTSSYGTSSDARLPPSSGTSDAGVEDASMDAPAAAYACEGAPLPCRSFDSVYCEQQRGCVVSLNDGACYGAPVPCDGLGEMSTCERQVGCWWAPASPR